jgi:hypothetical protein
MFGSLRSEFGPTAAVKCRICIAPSARTTALADSISARTAPPMLSPPDYPRSGPRDGQQISARHSDFRKWAESLTQGGGDCRIGIHQVQLHRSAFASERNSSPAAAAGETVNPEKP